jgi:exosortase A-associated hydrolase 1
MAPSASALGVVVVVGGPQVRAGSHRQFVQLARALASAGHPVLRFDVRGMGDSSGAQRSFEHITPDIASTIDTMMKAEPRMHGVVLWGLCDGASAALLYLDDTHDRRVLGLCLVNPWLRSAQTLARARVKNYYWQRLRQREFWLKLLQGRVKANAGLGLLQQITQAQARAGESADQPAFQQRMLRAWRAFNAPVLMVLSGNDLTAQEFLEHTRQVTGWQLHMSRPKLQLEHVPNADHTFSAPLPAALLLSKVVTWMNCLADNTPKSTQ